jgi:putative hydrolase of the HAD superfamily
MEHIKAIGFDLFNTLLTVEPSTLAEASARLLRSLRESGLPLDAEPFQHAYRKHALRLLEATRKDGRETHNRLWISAALAEMGHEVAPDDPRIATGVEAYFSAFAQQCRLLPGTLEMLERLKPRFHLGLLSNFTHGPAAWQILRETGLRPIFPVVLISGEIGYRKPHPSVFHRLVNEMKVGREEILYIGDDPGPDIYGAQDAGIQPVWTTYAQEMNVRHVADLAYTGLPSPDGRVPRIGSWEDLFALLEDDRTQ